MEQHELVLEFAPYMLSVSPLDCEDWTCCTGSIAPIRAIRTGWWRMRLGVSPAAGAVVDIPGATMVECEPSLTDGVG